MSIKANEKAKTKRMVYTAQTNFKNIGDSEDDKQAVSIRHDQ
jgi:hypothetical protein